MKHRIATLIAFAVILSACNMSLAEDVTPPPGYIPPTPAPALVLVPPQTPNVPNGKAIYFEKCAACHGDTGLGDGEQGIQLGVTVPAFALPEVARSSSPAQWYTVVTRGRIERFMPPFASLNDQERWDVVAYITTLHTSEEEVLKGKDVFEDVCGDCSTEYFENQNKMSGLSTIALARIIRLGNEDVQAFGESLSDDEMWAVAEYLRSLTYETSPLSPQVADSPTQTPSSAEGTPVEEGQVEVTPEAPLTEGYGRVSGTIDNQTGRQLPDDLAVTLRGFQHDFANPNAGTQEILSIETTVASDGTFSFENVEIPEGRIFLAEVNRGGIELSSDPSVVEADQTEIVLPPLVLYDVTENTSSLSADELDIFVTITNDGNYEMLALHTFRNTGTSIVRIVLNDMQEIPFLRFPVGAAPLGYEAMQDSAPFISTSDGFAMKPTETTYGVLAFSSITKVKETSVSQPLALPVDIVRVLVPDGMSVVSGQLTPDTPQTIQGEVYQAYFAHGLAAGDVLQFTLMGEPARAGAADSRPDTNLLIGITALGVILLLSGAWMYMRDRKPSVEAVDTDYEEEFESSEDVLDAIIALDDLHRKKKISDEAYNKRRSELKEILKDII